MVKENAKLEINSNIESFRQHFLSQAQKKLSREESERLWEQIANSNAYTFNKAHAVAYSYLSYYFSFLKANYFSSLIEYYLNSCLNSSEKTLAYLQEAFFFDFAIQKPDINFSEINWTKKETTTGQKSLVMGFASLKDFSTEFFEGIIEERKKKGKFKSWEDLLTRTKNQWEKISLNTFCNWIKIGLFASLKVSVERLLENQKVIFRYCQLKLNFPHTSRFLPPLIWPTKKPSKSSDTSLEPNEVKNSFQINCREWENLGVYISYFSVWKEVVKKIPSIQNLTNLRNQSGVVKVYAIVQDIKLKRNLVDLVLFDTRSTLKLSISQEFYQKNQTSLLVHQPVLFYLAVRVENRKIQELKVEKVEIM